MPTFKITKLEPGSAYDIYVVAVRNTLESENSEILQAKTIAAAAAIVAKVAPKAEVEPVEAKAVVATPNKIVPSESVDDGTDVSTVEADSTEYHKGWFHTIKLIVLILKVVIVSYLTMKAMHLRHKKYLKVDTVQFLLVGNVAILIGVLIFDLTKKYILAFFLLIYLANYINFLGFN